MLDELLKHNKLGNKNELMFLLLKALPLAKNQKTSDLRAYCTSNHYSIGQSLDGILKLLEFMKLANFSNETISLDDAFFTSIKNNGENFEQDIFTKSLLIALRNEGVITNIIPPDGVKRDADDGYYYVKENLIPLQFISIRNLLISLEFFERRLLYETNILVVNRGFNEFFQAEIVNNINNEKDKRRRVSLQELKNRLDNQERLGKEAELFVLNFEKQRLSKHPLVGNVLRVSEDHINAGFDIESFNDNNSVFTDRFIEVKSHSENIAFFWSANEVEVAKNLANKYFLYLVDRTKMSQDNYVPKIFQNPYQSIFENELWNKEPQTWKFSLQEDG
jgi:hypothetical protein